MNKAVLLLFFLFVPLVSAEFAFQDQPNSTSFGGDTAWSCGANNSCFANTFDDDYNSLAHPQLLNKIAWGEYNFTIPANVVLLGSMYENSDKRATTVNRANSSLNQSCITRANAIGIVEIRVEINIESGNSYVWWNCYNGTSWVKINGWSHASNTPNVLEGSDMWWKVSTPPVQVCMSDLGGPAVTFFATWAISFMVLALLFPKIQGGLKNSLILSLVIVFAGLAIWWLQNLTSIC